MATLTDSVTSFLAQAAAGLPDQATEIQAWMTQGDNVSFSALSEPTVFALPPEVAAMLNPGTNPFASLAVSYPPNTSAGAPVGSPSITPAPNLAVAPAGSGGLVGVGGLPTPVMVSPLNAVVTYFPTGEQSPGAALIDNWASMPSGQIFFEQIRNRQPGGVRFGSLPMVVFQDNGGSDTRGGGGVW